jgi:hypothetical protein
VVLTCIFFPFDMEGFPFSAYIISFCGMR